MASIFVDTTRYITLGLLDINYNWLSYKTIKDSQASAVIHYEIDKMMSEKFINIIDIDKFFYAAGPGSYTGMRVSQGLAQIFNYSGVEVFSFYHFEVPRILNINKGFWSSDAFKNELFIYQWDGDRNSKSLRSKDKKISEPFYSSYDGEDNLNTSSLILNQSNDFFYYLENVKMKKELYYYRDLEEEFKAK